MNPRMLCLTMTLIALTANKPCASQDVNSDPLKVVAKYVEPSTVAVVDVNMESIDSKVVLDWAGKLVDAEVDPTLSGMASTVIAAFQGAGVKHAYLLLSTQSMSDGSPVVVIPCDHPKNIEGFLTMFVQNSPPDAKLTIRITDGVVFIGPETAFNRMALATPTPRPDLLEPLAAKSDANGGKVTVVFSLPEESRKQLVTFWPNEFTVADTISLSPKQIMEDVDRVVAMSSLPPLNGLNIHLRTNSSAAAERTNQVLDQFAKLAPEVAAQVQRTVSDQGVTLVANADAIHESLGKLLRQAREDAAVQMQMNHLRQLGLAIHNYADAYQELPPRVFVDPAGKPLFGWTVALLPYLEQQALYNEFKLDQRWDSEANRKLTKMLIQVFSNDAVSGTKTTFRAPVYPGSLWEGEGAPRKFADITDGTSNTIALIDAPRSAAIEWADPTPWVISKDDPMKDVFGDRESVTCLFLDGSVRRFTKGELTNEKLGAMLTIAGGEVVE